MRLVSRMRKNSDTGLEDTPQNRRCISSGAKVPPRGWSRHCAYPHVPPTPHAQWGDPGTNRKGESGEGGGPHGAHSQEGQLPGRYPREEGCEDLLREDEPHDGHEAACDAPIQHLAPGVVEQVDPGGHRALLSSGELAEGGPTRAVCAHAEATPGPDPQAAGGGGLHPNSGTLSPCCGSTGTHLPSVQTLNSECVCDAGYRGVPSAQFRAAEWDGRTSLDPPLSQLCPRSSGRGVLKEPYLL